MNYSALSLAMIAALSLPACIPVSENDANSERICAPELGQVTTSDGRTLCIGLSANHAAAPFMPGFQAPARVEHSINIFDARSNSPVDITSDAAIVGLTHYPLMTMLSGHSHSTPIKTMPSISGAAHGHYHTVAYYLMPSAMNGTVTGEWEYRVMLKDKGADGIADSADDQILTARFHPVVSMVMGGNKFSEKTERRTSGVYEDKMASMSGATLRTYGIWLESTGNNGDGSHTLMLFINTKDNRDMMGGMSHDDMDMAHYPGLVTGMSLKDENNAVVNVDNVIVEVSAAADPQPTDWTTLSAATDGYYQGNVTGLATDTQNTLQVRVTVTTTVGGVTTTEVMSAKGFDDTMPTLIFTAPQ